MILEAGALERLNRGPEKDIGLISSGDSGCPLAIPAAKRVVGFLVSLAGVCLCSNRPLILFAWNN